MNGSWTRKAATSLVVAVAVLAGAACSNDEPRDAGERTARREIPQTKPGEPYPYTERVPEREKTPIDGTYVRTIPEGVVGKYVKCRRCPPFRLDKGESEITFDRGWFQIGHDVSGFHSLSHYEVDGDTVEFFNDPNCPDDTGEYRFTLADGELVFEEISDPCGFGLRAKDLTFRPWRS